MPLLTLTDVSLAYGHHPLLSHVDFAIEAGERVCLVGRNGAGKSTLLKTISNEIEPDDGVVWRQDTLRISHLIQEVPEDLHLTIYDVVAQGLGKLGKLLAEYHHVVDEGDHSDPAVTEKISGLQHEIEVLDGWNLDQKVSSILSKLDLEQGKHFNQCSGGLRRRVLLAQALVSEPDILLLDEPTNHMDIAAITWLEEYLKIFSGALIFITHDRTFSKNLATRIVELDRGKLTSFPGNYEHYLRKKSELLEIEAREFAKFDKKLSEEEAWIRQGIKARRTRNEGRVRALKELREQRRQRVTVQGKVSLNVDTGEKSGKIVADLRDVNFSYDGVPIIKNLSTRIIRGDRVGIIGPNGSGKSTLLKILLGELQPDSGVVTLGTKLDIAYFDQYRATLDTSKTVRDNISEGSDYVSVKGRSRHVIGYLKQFLFPPERIDTPIKILSGGERNRLLLAKLFTKPANMMVLDEPTNDLDVDTLELLEELLLDYDGTLLLVSHDRSFLDNVVTSTLVFEGDGNVGEYVGGYEDYLRQRRSGVSTDQAKITADSSITQTSNTREKPKTKLSYREQRELENLPAKIEKMEADLVEIQKIVSDTAFYQQDKEDIANTMKQMENLESELTSAYGRWEELDQF